jgi:transposase
MLASGKEAAMAKKKGRTGRGVDGRPGRRYEMTDDGYGRIEDFLPRQQRGGKWADHRTVLNGIFWVLNSGAHWRDMPTRYGKWETVYGRYRRWTREGLFDKILERLHVSLDDEGRIDWSVFDVDGSNVRAHRVAAGASETSKKTGRTSRETTPWDDPAEALARSFIL